MCKSELKRRSYGRLKTTASSCAKISQLSTFHYENFAATKSACENFARCFAAAKPPASTRVPLRKLKLHLRSCKPRCEITSKLRIKLQIISKLRNHLQVANQVANHLQVEKSPPSCEITNSTCKIKVQTCEMDTSNL